MRTRKLTLASAAEHAALGLMDVEATIAALGRSSADAAEAWAWELNASKVLQRDLVPVVNGGHLPATETERFRWMVRTLAEGISDTLGYGPDTVPGATMDRLLEVSERVGNE